MSLIRGDALTIPLADNSVDLIVTSPPYFALRSYTDEGEHYAGQIGSEATPAEFIDALVSVTRECVRVLKPSGSLFVNLGDKYAGGAGHNNNNAASNASSTLTGGRGKIEASAESMRTRRPPVDIGIRAKSLMGLPWRYALACIDQLGLILRAEIIWSKPNGLPESVQDRVRRSHEQWFHFTLEPRYYSAVDEIREAGNAGNPAQSHAGYETKDSNDGVSHRKLRRDPDLFNPLGKLPGSVWTIDSQQWLDGPIAFCPRCGRDLRAGHGQDGRTGTATATTGSPTTGNGESTGSPTDSGSGPSPTGTPSTTPATTTPVAQAAEGAPTDSASTPTTSRPYPCESTSSEETPSQPSTPPRPTASTATSSTPSTPTTEDTAGESAACVCESGWRPDAPESVWVVPTEPLQVPDHLPQHFAAFPSEFPRRIILGWSPSGICTECGEGRRPVVETDYVEIHSQSRSRGFTDAEEGVVGRGSHGAGVNKSVGSNLSTITGESCACDPHHADFCRTDGEFVRCSCRPSLPPTRKAVVLDPFAGTGTTVAVANHLGRYGVGIDLSADYLRLARWRCQDPGLRAKVLRVDKPAPEVPGQMALL